MAGSALLPPQVESTLSPGSESKSWALGKGNWRPAPDHALRAGVEVSLGGWQALESDYFLCASLPDRFPQSSHGQQNESKLLAEHGVVGLT